MKPLSNPNASFEAQKLYYYICDINGKHILSGQQENPHPVFCDDEMNYIASVTGGKLPCIRGLDYIHDDFKGTNERSIKWYEKGGIVSICWHWGAPPYGIGYPSSQGEIDMIEATTEGTFLYQEILNRIDEAAIALKELQSHNIPVLWRPLHEFDGAWFWWGKGGNEPFIKLWRTMYERMTDFHGLDNLIWVLGYCGDVKDGWYPGDAYVDIVGADNYAEGPQKKSYDRVYAITEDSMPIAYHENGPLPKPEDMIKAHTPWAWFLTWHTIHIKEQNSPEYVHSIFNHPYVLTLEDLPTYKA